MGLPQDDKSTDDNCPFDGEIPVARVSRKHLSAVPSNILDKIKTLPMDRLSFGDFAKLKSGRDEFSKIKFGALFAQMNGDDRKMISDAIAREADQAKAMRWVLRGLTAEKAIRKVKTDLQITAKVVGNE